MFARCPYCHKRVFFALVPVHLWKHVRLLADGQMEDHITLPPDERQNSALQGVPRVYRHPKCGSLTRMPEEIIRSYLANPFLYGSTTFCCGCGKYVQDDEVFWIETGQSLHEYTRDLQEAYIREHGRPPRRKWFGLL